MGDISSGTTILCAERQNYTAGWGAKPHTHDCWHLFYLWDGACQMADEQGGYRLQAGQAALFAPGRRHAFSGVEAGGMTVTEVLFRLDGAQPAERLALLPTRLPANDTVRGLLRTLEHIGPSRRPDWREAGADCLRTLLWELCLLAAPPDPRELNAQRIDTDGYTELAAAVIRYVDEHCTEETVLEGAAAALGYNKSYLCTAFRRSTGFTVTDYANFVRILRAADYLSYYAGDLADVYARLGFRGASHFNRTFKKYLGVPPGQFRRVQAVNMNEAVLGDSELQELLRRLPTVLGDSEG